MSYRRRSALILAVMLVYGAFACVKAAIRRGGFSASIVAGDVFVDRAKLDQPIAVLSKSAGYDGQFFYRLALEPFTNRKVDHGIVIDNPSQRQQRIGYPLIAHILSFGDAALTPFVLVALNVLALGLLAWTATGIATHFGRPAWQGLVIPLYPGLLLSLARDTAEIVAAAFATLALYAALRGRYWQAGLLGCAAALTRETALLYLVGFGLVVAAGALHRHRWDWRIAAYIMPAVVLVVWQFALVATWKHTSFSGVGHDDFGSPLIYLAAALYRDLVTLDQPHFRFDNFYFPLTKLFVIAQTAVVAVAVARTRHVDWRLIIPWLFYLAMAALFTDAIWIEPFGYLRILADLYILGCIVLLSGPAERTLRGLMIAAPLALAASWPYAL